MFTIHTIISKYYFNMRKIGFGGGCHWCTEAIFQSLKGVHKVEQGWISSLPPNTNFSEGVIVHYDEDIDLETLIEIHLLTHSSASNHSMHHKYRSAVYYFEEQDREEAIFIINSFRIVDHVDYITQVLPYVDFRLNTQQYLNYYKKDKNKPFCQTYISPKLRLIRSQFAKSVRDDY